MLLQEVFDQLASSELNNIYVVDQETKTILPDKYATVIAGVNAALTQLHTRFMLRTGELKIALHPKQTVYPLQSRCLIGKDGIPTDTKFMYPSADFRDNLLKIQQVFDDKGQELGLNNHTDYYSVRESSYDTLVVPIDFFDKHNVKELRVVYRQNHKMIPTCCDGIEPDCYGLTLPRTHLMALCLYVAARMHVPIGLQDATYSGNSFMALYEQECNRLEQSGMQMSAIAASEGVLRKGFP